MLRSLRRYARELVLPIPFGPLRGSLWRLGSGARKNALGTYDPEKVQLLADEVEQGAVFFDIGANVGYYTLLASKLVGARGRVVAIEPLPMNAHRLREHIRLNDISNVEVLEVAVSDVTGWMTFEQGDSDFNGKLSSGGGMRVPSVRLDDLVGRTLPIPGYIKLHIEGGELKALTGSRETLSQHSVGLLLSVHGEDSLTECMDFLADIGYAAHPVAGDFELYCVRDHDPR